MPLCPDEEFVFRILKMRDCYKKFWKTVLVEKMHITLPQFALKEQASAKAEEEITPPIKPMKFVWNPIDKLTFTIEFAVPGKQDGFEAYCKWSERGNAKAQGMSWLNHPFAENTFEESDAVSLFQSLSADLGDKPRVMGWKFWKPTTLLESSAESHAAWKAEFIAEELRPILDVEARQRVEETIAKTMVDLKRCAMPWFEKKLAWYQSHRQK